MPGRRAAQFVLVSAIFLVAIAASTAAPAQGDVIRHPGLTERPQVQSGETPSSTRGRIQNPAVTPVDRTPPRAATTPVITNASPLPPATQGESYKIAIEVAGGTPPYILGFGSGKLPPGLSLKDGIISGMPTASGSTFALRVTDAKKASSAKQFALEVRTAKKPAISTPGLSVKDRKPDTPPLMITDAAALPPGTMGFFYGHEFHATGGTPPHTFKATAGQMPPGLSFVSVRSIMGDATAVGPYSFTVTVTDNAGKTAEKTFSLAIFAEPALTSPLTLPAAIVGKAYKYAFEATGGAPPFAIEGLDPLPAGLTLNAGVISGVPLKSGAFHFGVRLTDAATRTLAVTYYLTVVPPLTIATATLPKAYIGAPYAEALTTSGGFPPSTMAVAGGQLPPGLGLTGNAVTGSANTAGTWTFQVKATDSAQDTAAQSLSVTVEASAAQLVAVSPMSATGFYKPPKDYTNVTKLIAIAPMSAQGYAKVAKDTVSVTKTVPIAQPMNAVGFYKTPKP